MFCIKGGKHIYLIDFNPHCNLPVWSNVKDDAFMSDFAGVQEVRKFLKETQGVDYDIEYV